jgi:hypothetical protein
MIRSVSGNPELDRQRKEGDALKPAEAAGLYALHFAKIEATKHSNN